MSSSSPKRSSELPLTAALSAALIATILAIVPGVARAQQRTQPTSPRGPQEGTDIPPGLRIADLKFGPFYLQPRLAIRDTGYDSSVAGTRTVVGETSDFRATPSLGLKVAVPIRDTHMVTADGQVDYLWYAKFDELRTFNTAVSARYDHDSERWRLGLYTRLWDASRTQLDYIEIGDEPIPPDTDIFTRSRQYNLDSGGAARLRFQQRLFLEGRGSRRIVRYDEESLSEALDRTEESIGGSMGFQVTSKTAVALVVDWRLDEYETPGNFRSGETYRAGARLEMSPSGLLSGDVFVGYRDLAPRNADVLGFSGIVAEGAVAVQPGGFLQVRLSGIRDTFATSWFNNIYALQQGGSLAATMQLNRGLVLGGDVGLSQNSYPEPATRLQPDGSILTARRLDRIYRFGATIGWQGIQTRIGYIRRSSNFESQNADGFVIGSGYSYAF